MASHRPSFLCADAEQLAREHYDLHGTAKELPSYADQNFLLHMPDGTRYVLKIANAEESDETLSLQNDVLHHLSEHDQNRFYPKVLPSRHGNKTERVNHNEKTWRVRLVTYLSGIPLAHVNPQETRLIHQLGIILGQVDHTLFNLDHPGAHRTLDWDILRAPTTIERLLPAVGDTSRTQLLRHHLSWFELNVADVLPSLRTGIVHNDANDFNVLVSAPSSPQRHITGLIDWGDVLHTCVIAELAIASAYLMLDKPDPLSTITPLIAGYHAAYPLEEAEVAALFGLITMRLCTSAVMAARQLQMDPDNTYLRTHADPAWRMLEHLQSVSPAFAHYTFRHACGWEPCPQTPRLRTWLQEHASSFAPVVHPDPRQSPVTVFDFSVSSTEWSPNALMLPGHAADQLAQHMRTKGVQVGVGRYDEARMVYQAEQFGMPDSVEQRTIHIGIDLFQPSGAPIFAPLDGVVHSLQDNNQLLDYGPTIILEHEADDRSFYTLYGHLSHESLHWEPGTLVSAGTQIATLGTADVNGGWAPHLHFQIIADLLGKQGDFPGVAPAQTRSIWKSLCPDPNLILQIPERHFPPLPLDAPTIQAKRKNRLNPALSLSYQKPLHIVRGVGARLFDNNATAYLDCVNNVAHVGHGHSAVVAAAQRQIPVLNTNTRYLHENIVRYAERLTNLLPAPLSMCFFVNSGSEANDLALRMARTYTGARDLLVLDGAYHGHTQALIEASPYKHDGPGGKGAPSYVHPLAMPDDYRGAFKRGETHVGRRYAEAVAKQIEKLQRQKTRLAGFIHESLLSCGGQIVLPDGYLANVYQTVQAAGGVCIADEVQVGFGRVGTHFWGFETQGVIPDIVTMGKPIGNGHPLAAVVTTPEIAGAFANGMEYFNTFGGNPVSCAVGLAVLDVIEQEGLQAHALDVGTHLKQRLARLMEQHAIIGDVRGLGLFLGIELVRDRTTLEPAAEAARYLVNRMKDHRILLSTDGPLHNVIKIKPPLVFSEADANRLVDTLDRVLGEDFIQAHVIK